LCWENIGETARMTPTRRMVRFLRRNSEDITKVAHRAEHALRGQGGRSLFSQQGRVTEAAESAGVRVDSDSTVNDGEQPPKGGDPRGSQHDIEQLDEEYVARPSALQLRTGLILSLVGVLTLAVLSGGAWALRGASKTCSGKPVPLRVIAATDIAPALGQVAARFNVQTHDVRGRCVRVEVTERHPAQASRALSGGGSVKPRAEADAWVPDSSMWVGVARASAEGAKLISPRTTSIAQSPVVLVTPKPVAAELRKKKIKPTWRMAFPASAQLLGGPSTRAKVSVQILDPATSASGIATMIAARRVIGDSKRASAVLTGFVRDLQRNASGDTTALYGFLSGVPGGGRPLVVASEQSVVDYNLTHQPNPATALVPEEGTLALDYPFVVTTNDEVRKEAAEAFRYQVQSRLGQDVLQRAGFRTPTGAAAADVTASNGLAPGVPKRMLTPTPGQVNEALQAWNRLGLGSRILVLSDISGTMALPVPGGTKSRMQVANEAALTGLQLFPDDTDIGLWEFSTLLDGKKDYRVRVPLGPITEELEPRRTRRAVIQKLASTLQPKVNGDTGLYDSVLASYRSMKKRWRPDKFNSVLVLTDGVGNDDPQGGLSHGQFMKKLRGEIDPRRPIQVIIVAFGPDVDPVTMREIASPTGGAAYTTKDPRQIVNVFLEAIGRRLCNPDCGGEN
jgi:ABC-type molybdate transport system substrate-binding protein